MKTIDWRQHDSHVLGAGLMGTVAVVGYVLLVHGPLTDSLRYGQVRQRHDGLALAVGSLRSECDSIAGQIEETKSRAAAEQSMLPDSHTVDDLLSRLHDLGSQCGVVLTRLQPTGIEQRPGYQIRTFHIEGRATFPALHRWFGLIEVGVPYLDITHFSISTSKNKQQQNDVCRFECTKRFYFSESDPDDGPTTPVKRR